jgi:hypothetical protein
MLKAGVSQQLREVALSTIQREETDFPLPATGFIPTVTSIRPFFQILQISGTPEDFLLPTNAILRMATGFW